VTDHASSQDPNTFFPSSGGASLAGYFYQLDASILTALDLVLARRVAQQVVLEPASQEDLEAEVENAPGALTETIALDTYRLVIQCKLRSTGPWKHEELTRLLAHGTRRTSAKDRLLEPRLRYLLITSADLDGVARKLRVEVVGDWPSASDLPTEMGNNLPAGVGGRIAVLASMDQEKVNSRIERLLAERFRVPHSNIKTCRDALQREALLRMRGAAHGVWDRSDIERIITSSSGYAGESDALEGFVPPTNWDELKEALRTKNAVIITGASGTGKTRAAKALIADLRDSIPGLRHVIVQGDPEKIQSDQQAGPVVYEIEDPWGRFRLEPTSVPWNDAINDILQSAHPDRKFVITSRSDVLHENNPRSLKKKWFITLEEENYGPKQRVALFENRLPGLSPELQPIALQYRKQAVDRLLTPLEMHRYFAVLGDGLEGDENERQYIERCLSDAQLSSIETALLNSVRQRQAWVWAAVVWGLFKARSRLTFKVLPSIQAGLTKRQADLEDGLEPCINFLVAGRNLRQSEAMLTYQHPRVELGLEQALKERAGQSSRILGYLVDVLIELDTRTGVDWGTESAAHLVSAARDQDTLALSMSSEARSNLDRWIEDRLASTGPDFGDDLKLAAVVGSEICVLAEVARWLTNPPKLDPSWLIDDWSLPDRTPQWYERSRAHPKTAAVCAAFITRELPHRHRSFPDDFAKSIASLSDDLTSAFTEAARSMVKDGYNPNASAIAEGAIADLEAFEKIVAAAVDYEEALYKKGDDGLWLAVANGEYDDAAAEHYYESASEDGYTASIFLERYVSERRNRDGWAAIRDHARAAGLTRSWLQILAKAKNATPDEWAAIGKAVRDNAEETQLWERVTGSLPRSLLPQLGERLKAGSENRSLRIESLKTVVHDASNGITAVVQSLIADGNIKRLLELALDIVNADRDKEQESKNVFSRARALIARALPETLSEAVNAIFRQQPQNLSAGAFAHFATLNAGRNSELKLVQAEALAAKDIDVEQLLREVLSAPDDDDAQIATATKAVVIAAERGLWPLVEECLKHRFADVRQEALVALAARTRGRLAPSLLELASDKGHRVREALLQLIKENPHPDNMGAILQLASDTWTPQQVYYGEDAHYPIAQSAAELLSDAPQIDDTYVSAIGKVFQETSDNDVKLALMRALVRNGSDDARRRVMRYALRTGNPPHHKIAAEALVDEYRCVDEALAAEVTDEQLVLRAAGVAYQLVLLVGLCAEPARVLAAAKAIAAKPERRALLLPLAIVLVRRDEALADEVKKFLPKKMASDRSGPGCLNRFSASISGASAMVRLPCGLAAR
jgi:hypothetical protein